MPRQHYLPATFLAGFSDDQVSPRRRRRLHAAERQTGRSYLVRAERLAAINDFYLLQRTARPFAQEKEDGASSTVVDDVWSRYEDRLADAIETLTTNTTGRIDARIWTRVLVPFVAGLLLRGPDFNERFAQRMQSRSLTGGISKQDHINLARLFELQRLLAPVMTARWLVAHTDGTSPLISNDLGYAIYRDPEFEMSGMAVPLNQHAVLCLVPLRSRRILEARGFSWAALIEHRPLDPGNHRGLNDAIALAAQRFMYGATQKAVEPHLQPLSEDRKHPPEPGQLGFAVGPLAVVHEFAWHRLVSSVARAPGDARVARFELDWQAISEDWSPPVYFPANLPEFPPSLRVDGDFIDIELYEVPGFTDQR
jgi:uncharacterized protein DUF4238